MGRAYWGQHSGHIDHIIAILHALTLSVTERGLLQPNALCHNMEFFSCLRIFREALAPSSCLFASIVFVADYLETPFLPIYFTVLTVTFNGNCK